jgi:RNA polymerase sigma factor (sigma-70 family)
MKQKAKQTRPAAVKIGEQIGATPRAGRRRMPSSKQGTHLLIDMPVESLPQELLIQSDGEVSRGPRQGEEAENGQNAPLVDFAAQSGTSYLALFDDANENVIVLDARVLKIRAEMTEFVYVDNPLFHEADGKTVADILSPMPNSEGSVRRRKAPKGTPAYLASLYEVPLLEREQERHLFRQMNYLRHLQSKTAREITECYQERHFPGGGDWDAHLESLCDEYDSFKLEAEELRKGIVSANLRLVVNIARTRAKQWGEDLFYLISEGNMALIRAVGKFDYAKGNKFATYATWAIKRQFINGDRSAIMWKKRVRTVDSPCLEDKVDARPSLTEIESDHGRRVEFIASLTKYLNAREVRVIQLRYGLEGFEPRTLQEAGRELGVTKERIRQIQAKAEAKMQRVCDGLARKAESFLD